MEEHLADIRHNRDKLVAKHFNLPGNTTQNLTSFIIESVNTDPDLEQATRTRRNRESYWIHQLRTLKPLGINDHAWRVPLAPQPF